MTIWIDINEDLWDDRGVATPDFLWDAQDVPRSFLSVTRDFGPLHPHSASQPARTYDRPSWDEWALCIAEVVASRADCTRSQVGAVILSHDHRVLSVGYNGVIAGVPGCMTAGNCPRGRLSYDDVPADSDYSNCVATHAERNAIEHAPARELSRSTLYVTRNPCPACLTLIEACDIARVVTPESERCGHPDAYYARNAADEVLFCTKCDITRAVVPQDVNNTACDHPDNLVKIHQPIKDYLVYTCTGCGAMKEGSVVRSET